MRLELTQNLWERYGFLDNPFDTRALSITPKGNLSVKAAFVGRTGKTIESKVMTNFLRSPGGGRMVVEGDVGVGKTTFVNYHRYLWENEAKTKLITPASEISVHENWGAREFLISIIGALAGRLALTMGEKSLKKDKLLMEIFAITGVLINEITNYGGGVSWINFSRSKSVTIQIGEISLEKLQFYLHKLMERVRKFKYSGAIIQLNNLELLVRQDSADLKRFFDEIRDYLQERDIYFIFVGYTGMFQKIIVPLERVRSIFFGQPIHLDPLTRDEVHCAIERRYELLSLTRKKFIRPIDDTLIDYLYNIFSGKIRFIMDAITTVVTHLPEGITGTLTSESAQQVLKQLAQQRIGNLLTEAEQNILRIVIKKKLFSNSSLAKAAGKSKQSITKYLNSFKDNNFIYQKEKKGRNVYYEITPDLLLLCTKSGK